MDKKLKELKQRLEKDKEAFEKQKNRLHSNPIKNRLNQFITSKLKLSALDMLRSK